jgi:hypothetical protein
MGVGLRWSSREDFVTSGLEPDQYNLPYDEPVISEKTEYASMGEKLVPDLLFFKGLKYGLPISLLIWICIYIFV